MAAAFPHPIPGGKTEKHNMDYLTKLSGGIIPDETERQQYSRILFLVAKKESIIWTVSRD
jgi:hypothetical protein